MVIRINGPLLAAASIVFWSSLAWGQRMSQTVMDSAAGRTVDEIVALALQKNGEVLAAREQVAAARGGLTQARLRPNPSLEFSDFQEAAGSQNNFTIGASLPLELYHRRDRRIQVAESSVKVSELDQAERERQVRAEVEAKFGEVLAALRNLQFTEELVELNRKALELTEARVEKGASAPLEANILRVEVNRIDSLRADWEAKVGMALLELKSLAGMRPEDSLRLQGTLEPEAGVMKKEDAVRLARETRPDLLAWRAAEKVAEGKVKQAKTEARPDASLTISYQRMDSSFALNGLTAAGQTRPIQGLFHYLAAGVSISLPVRNRNEGAIESAVAQVEEAKRRREYAELIAEREIAAAYLVQEKAKESVDIFGKRMRDQAAQNLEVVRRTYELGRTQLLDVIAEQRRFIDVETGYTDALNRYFQASVRLRAATGFVRP